MAKLDTTNTFDNTIIANTKTYQEAQPFFDYFGGFVKDVLQSYQNNITFKDNIKSKTSTYSVQNNIPLAIGAGKTKPKIILLNSLYKIKNYVFYTDSSDTLQLQINFDEIIKKVSDSAVWQSGTIVKYRCQSVSDITYGSFVKFSGFGTANNNGTFQVIDIDTTNRLLYCINYKRTSATGDETRTSYAGENDGTRQVTILSIYD